MSGITSAAKNQLLCNNRGKERGKGKGEEKRGKEKRGKKPNILHCLMVPGVSIQTRCLEKRMHSSGLLHNPNDTTIRLLAIGKATRYKNC